MIAFMLPLMHYKLIVQNYFGIRLITVRNLLLDCNTIVANHINFNLEYYPKFALKLSNNKAKYVSKNIPVTGHGGP
jgi:hypothetical protein